MLSKEIENFTIYIKKLRPYSRIIVKNKEWYHTYVSKRMSHEEALNIYENTKTTDEITKLIIPYTLCKPKRSCN